MPLFYAFVHVVTVSEVVSAEDPVVCVIADSAGADSMTANPENVSLSGCAGRSKMSGSPDSANVMV